ncbi:hypothetical protein JKP88DRAFT_348824 [Tribonema minus]|uniref:Uncharacterized protein n=1 Tax=Tribonema minus TaxID=303371 RepID=A0A835YVV2_9STRA|nr:hypothetical protein JKP88DRAFT_348824 [Tribonema minus]
MVQESVGWVAWGYAAHHCSPLSGYTTAKELSELRSSFVSYEQQQQQQQQQRQRRLGSVRSRRLVQRDAGCSGKAQACAVDAGCNACLKAYTPAQVGEIENVAVGCAAVAFEEVMEGFPAACTAGSGGAAALLLEWIECQAVAACMSATCAGQRAACGADAACAACYAAQVQVDYPQDCAGAFGAFQQLTRAPPSMSAHTRTRQAYPPDLGCDFLSAASPLRAVAVCEWEYLHPDEPCYAEGSSAPTQAPTAAPSHAPTETPSFAITETPSFAASAAPAAAGGSAAPIAGGDGANLELDNVGGDAEGLDACNSVTVLASKVSSERSERAPSRDVFSENDEGCQQCLTKGGFDAATLEALGDPIDGCFFPTFAEALQSEVEALYRSRQLFPPKCIDVTSQSTPMLTAYLDCAARAACQAALCGGALAACARDADCARCSALVDLTALRTRPATCGDWMTALKQELPQECAKGVKQQLPLYRLFGCYWNIDHPAQPCPGLATAAPSLAPSEAPTFAPVAVAGAAAAVVRAAAAAAAAAQRRQRSGVRLRAAEGEGSDAHERQPRSGGC